MNNTDNEKNGSAYHSNFEDHTSINAIVIINCVLNAPLMLISILGNALVLVAIIRTPSIRSTSMIMLGSLAVTDLLVGVIAQPLFTARQLTKDSDAFIYHLSQILGISLSGISLCTITAITVDRYLALHYHMRYAVLVTKSRVWYTLVMIWVTIFVLSNLNFWNNRAGSLLAAAITAICLIISTFCYTRIYRIVRHHQSQVHSQQQAVQSLNTEGNLNMMRLKKSTMNTFVFYVALIICYFPIYIIRSLHGISCRRWKTEWNFATTVVFMNSSINPILYCWRLRELRAAIVKTARKMLCTEID
ncbi:melanocyte-stimulating hormone receptor-like [Oculina patagonica]